MAGAQLRYVVSVVILFVGSPAVTPTRCSRLGECLRWAGWGELRSHSLRVMRRRKVAAPCPTRRCISPSRSPAQIPPPQLFDEPIELCTCNFIILIDGDQQQVLIIGYCYRLLPGVLALLSVSRAGVDG